MWLKFVILSDFFWVARLSKRGAASIW